MAQRRLKTKDLMDMNTETFDLAFYEKNKTEISNLNYYETQKDGTVNEIYGGGKVNFFINISSPPYYFVKIKEFNRDGKLIGKGILLGGCPIEKWLECDENGENCKVIDYEENRGRFSYEGVLKFLEKKKLIDKNVKDIESKTSFDLTYSYEQKTWEIKASYRNALGFYTFVLDGDSGKILSQKFTSTMY